jgi:dihydrofolate reductase
MGRKTWDSIPPKFRPLKNRLNIIVTRSAPTPPPTTLPPTTEPLRVSSLDHALSLVSQTPSVARVFVMGGAQIYDAAIKRAESKRVLLTNIQRDFECDTFFPVDVAESPEWSRKGREELEQWTGETVAEGGQEEAGTPYEFQMWEKS